MSAAPTAEAITRVWREESARVVGALTRVTRDLALAEEVAQDALVAALEEWPRTGVPSRPGAWLMTTAKNRAFNALKRSQFVDAHHSAHPPSEQEKSVSPTDELDARLDEDVSDDVLKLLFTACHPTLSREVRVTLTLRLVAGLTTAEIARAFLTTEPTIAQRVVRARRTLSDAGLPFEVPQGEALGARLSSVLEVVYLVFNEGYSASAGDDVLRPALVDEALRLSSLLVALAPDEPEVHGLFALLSLQASRFATRVDANGEPVLLADQDRSKWDAAAIARGLSALDRAGDAQGPYVLQASIAACHARARDVASTDWTRIAQLYGALKALVPSSVIELNRAVAVSRASGAAAGLALLDALQAGGELERYHFLPAARGELLERLGRHDEARAAFELAASLAENARQRERLTARAAKLTRGA
ncbi:MAG: sigma-70 family RNA polymerase sigma factor [Archangium sp.]|nr:sigma-70 family RNA polymerase sigma factor [Archangium sp.]